MTTKKAKRIKPEIFKGPQPEAIIPPPQISVSLHPIASIERRFATEADAPKLNSDYRWTMNNSIYYVRILSAKPGEVAGEVIVTIGVYEAMSPMVGYYPEAEFLRGAFA